MTAHKKTKIILEAASNHNGNIETAKDMVRTAAAIGADYIKFQSYRAEKLVNADDEEVRRRSSLELSDEDHVVLLEECRNSGIKFLTTPFDMDRIEFLSGLGLEEIKIASPDVGSTLMIEKLKQHFSHLIISTGMATNEEITKTAQLLKDHEFTFLHCVALYPTPPEKAHLIRMNWLRQFTSSVGLSCHSLDLSVAQIAIAQGADFVEQHFTLSRNQEDFGHFFSIEPQEAEKLVRWRDKCAEIIGELYEDCLDEELPMRDQFIGKWGDNR